MENTFLKDFAASVLDDEGLEEEFLSLITTSAHGDVIRFKCNRCFKSYKYRSDLTRHLKSECGVAPQFRCQRCDFRTKRFVSYLGKLGLLSAGKSRRARGGGEGGRVGEGGGGGGDVDGEERFACERCSRSYKNRGHLMRHIQYECGIEPRFKCPLCPHRSHHGSNMKVHMFLKHGHGATNYNRQRN
ncbi:zinc finger protein 790 [Nilaparvata lugens]|uniref:zinc finger protein 790 n=1 Tax=Nilaparvata lugens TaxID=108931 RepID=UPI00193E67EC|nr:zinc finger protein 790 [Nilaparvata lugens]